MALATDSGSGEEVADSSAVCSSSCSAVPAVAEQTVHAFGSRSWAYVEVEVETGGSATAGPAVEEAVAAHDAVPATGSAVGLRG